jgi:acyl-[acyl-carrier-protein]-phospholipid O-acyltransferase/long-chain-fatty-acid--[acyl-carrier-protein] ligase
MAGAVFIAPFVLFSASAGQLADKLEKSRLIRWIKLFEIAIMAIGLAGFWRRDLTLLFTAWRSSACTRRCSGRSSTRSCRSS